LAFIVGRAAFASSLFFARCSRVSFVIGHYPGAPARLLFDAARCAGIDPSAHGARLTFKFGRGT
jgi:hypothetical protein